MSVQCQSNSYSPILPILDEELLVPERDISNCLYMYMYPRSFREDLCQEMTDSPVAFLCKRPDTKSCPTVDQDYKYSKDLRKCYKINEKPKTWLQAMMSCSMEGGMLAVVDNSAEADFIKDMTESGKTYFVGVRKMFSFNKYFTVKGQRFYSSLHADTTDDSVPPRECGTLSYDDNSLYTTTADCDITLPFICEMEITV